ncbi:CDP-alcohol phosphatidyltransferase [Xylariaceae sp. FL1019]|nr:CDP-alcohol phosphatidyltransferase [Xylariaceae sp. FL1019]
MMLMRNPGYLPSPGPTLQRFRLRHGAIRCLGLGAARLCVPSNLSHYVGNSTFTTASCDMPRLATRPATLSRLSCPPYSTASKRPSILGTPCSSSGHRQILEENSSRCFSSAARRSAQPKDDPKKPVPTDGEGSKSLRKVLPSLTPHENIYTIPNLLTFSRLIATPFIGYAILHDAHTLALGLFAYAGVSDLLDGWIARRWKLQTVVGSVVDPMADKMLMTVLTVCLAAQGALPVWLAVIILGRDVGLAISAIYYRYISLPPPKTFVRYWDFSLPSAEVRPTTISKYNTFLQLGLMGATMVAPVVAVDVSTAMSAFQYIVATTTIWSGLSYVFSKDAVIILSENKEKGKPKDY